MHMSKIRQTVVYLQLFTYSCLLTYSKSLGHVRSQSKHSFVSITEKKCRAANATLNEFYDVLDDILWEFYINLMVGMQK